MWDGTNTPSKTVFHWGSNEASLKTKVQVYWTCDPYLEPEFLIYYSRNKYATIKNNYTYYLALIRDKEEGHIKSTPSMPESGSIYPVRYKYHAQGCFHSTVTHPITSPLSCVTIGGRVKGSSNCDKCTSRHPSQCKDKLALSVPRVS